jgi:signal peptidase
MRTRASLVLVVWVIGGFAIGLAVAAGGPVAFGMQSFAVLSGSMEPVLSTGDIVVEETVRPRDVRVGDIVTFNDPQQRGRRITHRVRSVHIERGRARFVTKGDANDSTETWATDANGRLGRVTYRIPLIGYGIARLNGPGAKLVLVMIPALLLAVLELVRIWRPKPRDPEVADATA